MAAHANLRASALLALTKLMALDPSFCDANLQLVFTLLHTKYALFMYLIPHLAPCGVVLRSVEGVIVRQEDNMPQLHTSNDAHQPAGMSRLP